MGDQIYGSRAFMGSVFCILSTIIFKLPLHSTMTYAQKNDTHWLVQFLELTVFYNDFKKRLLNNTDVTIIKDFL